MKRIVLTSVLVFCTSFLFGQTVQDLLGPELTKKYNRALKYLYEKSPNRYSITDFAELEGVSYRIGDSLQLFLPKIEKRIWWEYSYINSLYTGDVIPLTTKKSEKDLYVGNYPVVGFVREGDNIRTMAIVVAPDAMIWVDIVNAERGGEAKYQPRRDLNHSPLASTDKYAQLREAKKLLDEGLLTQEEFDKEKARILSGE